MTDNKVQTGAGDHPRIAVRLQLNLLEEAARSRVEQVLEAAINDELSRPGGYKTLPGEEPYPDIITVGTIEQPEDPVEKSISGSNEFSQDNTYSGHHLVGKTSDDEQD